MRRRPAISTRTETLFPDTTLVRSAVAQHSRGAMQTLPHREVDGIIFVGAVEGDMNHRIDLRNEQFRFRHWISHSLIVIMLTMRSPPVEPSRGISQELMHIQREAA